jgi:hypothetical protein
MQQGLQPQLGRSSQLTGRQQAPRSQQWPYRTAGQQHTITQQPYATTSTNTAPDRVARHAGHSRCVPLQWLHSMYIDVSTSCCLWEASPLTSL